MVSCVPTLRDARLDQQHNPVERGTIIAVHCSGSTAAQWRRLSESAAGFDVRCPDLYGCGRTGGWTGEGPFALANESERVLAMIDDCVGPVHLVGHSYGGAVALHAALRRAGRIASLALYEPTLFHLLPALGADGATAYAEITDIAAGVVEGVVTGDYRAAASRFVDYWSGAGCWAGLSPELQARVVRWIVKAPLDFGALFDDPTPAGVYATLDCPVLLMTGTQSPAPTRLATMKLAEIMPQARAVFVSDAGHMGAITHAAEVNAHILDLVRRTHADRRDGPGQRWPVAM